MLVKNNLNRPLPIKEKKKDKILEFVDHQRNDQNDHNCK